MENYNIKYYHSECKTESTRNRISRIRDLDKQWVKDDHIIQMLAKGFYHDFI